jgi:hypothetical protein
MNAVWNRISVTGNDVELRDMCANVRMAAAVMSCFIDTRRGALVGIQDAWTEKKTLKHWLW